MDVDYIIVGQGIAGTMLSWFLGKRGKTFLVIDEYNPKSSSQVAAGIIHPITGRRIVKTWMADHCIPFARLTYSQLESEFNARFFYDIPILELVDSTKSYNDWMACSESPEMQGYIYHPQNISPYAYYLKSDLNLSIEVRNSGWVDLKNLINVYRNVLIKNDQLIDQRFLYERLKLEPSGVFYNHIRAKKIIFCEGINALQNPFFKDEPFQPAKGEILTIKARMELHHILNRNIFILPLGNSLFKVGSTYDWNDLTNKPTDSARDHLLQQLDEIIKVPFNIVNHEAAVRPTVKDRRPLIFLHPEYPQIGIFNGLGTKGCLLAPFLAQQFADKL